jgi:hypothetical protein
VSSTAMTRYRDYCQIVMRGLDPRISCARAGKMAVSSTATTRLWGYLPLFFAAFFFAAFFAGLFGGW